MVQYLRRFLTTKTSSEQFGEQIFAKMFFIF